MDDHAAEIVSSFTEDGFAVECSCGFKVENLSSWEAAEDTVAWHYGESSTLGGGGD